MNSENYDKAILSLSSAGLGVSLTFLKNFVPFENAECTIILIISWFLFILAIISTISSFIVSQQGIEVQLDNSYKYYIEEKEEYFNKSNVYIKSTKYLNTLSGLCFIFAIIFTAIFVTKNM